MYIYILGTYMYIYIYMRLSFNTMDVRSSSLFLPVPGAHPSLYPFLPTNFITHTTLARPFLTLEVPGSRLFAREIYVECPLSRTLTLVPPSASTCRRKKKIVHLRRAKAGRRM